MLQREDFFHWRVICPVRSQQSALGALWIACEIKRSLLSFLLAVCCLVFFIQPLHAADRDKEYEFSIPRQSVEDALNALAEQVDALLLFPYDSVMSVDANPVIGVYTIEQALDVLLQDSGLSGDLTHGGVIAISPVRLNEREGSDMNSKKKLLTSLVGFFVGSGVASNGVAATAEEVKENKFRGMDEIVVTAQKRGERLIDVPISITAIGEESLKNAGVQNMNDLSYLVPNLSLLELSSGVQFISVRGVGNPTGTSPLVGLYLDEIPLSLSQTVTVDVQAVDLQRVEVLRGPQGTLYGQGSVGGTLRFISKKPHVEDVEGNLSVSLSNTTGGGLNQELEGAVNIPVIDDTLAFRVSATVKDNDGWIDQPGRNIDDANDTELSTINLKGLWQVSDNLTINATVIEYQNDTGGVNQINLGSVTDSNFQPTFRNGVDFPSTDINNDYDLYNLTLDYDLGFATLISSSSKIDFENIRSSLSSSFVVDVDQSGPIPEFTLDELYLDASVLAESFSQEVRLIGSTDKLDWVLGVFYADVDVETSRIYNQYIAGDPGSSSSSAEHAGNKSKAVFVNVAYDISSQLTFALGTRYFEDDRTIDYVFSSIGSAEDEGTFYNLSSKGSLSYQISEQATAYVSISEGFRSGGFSIPLPVNPDEITYDPENLLAYELGIKTSLLDRRLNLEAAIFRSEYSDFQDPSFNFDATGVIIANRGEVEIQGVEWSSAMSVTEDLSIAFNANYTDTEFTKVDDTASAFNKGDPVNFIPKFSYSFTADYNFNWSSSVSGFAHMDYNRQGKTSQTNRSPVLVNPVNTSTDIGFLNAQIGARWKETTFRLFGKNLNNELRSTAGSLGKELAQNRPRTIGIDVNYQF